MYLGLDIGTSVTKAALFDADGRECAQAARRTQLLPAPIGWSELDGDQVWQAVIDVIGDLFATSQYRPADVDAVGVTGVMVGAWLIDDRGELVRPPILWNDARAQAMVDEMVDRDPGLIAKVFSHSGSIMQLGCTLPVLAWLKKHEPRSLEKARHVFCAKDFITYRLTGAVVTDESEAAMAPGSARSRDFDAEPARLLGISDLMHLTAPAKRGETEAGRITARAAELTGLPIGTPVAVGTGDTGACAIGAGCHAPGQAVTVLGTTCLNGVLSDHAVYEPRNLGLLFILPGRRWMKTMVNVAGTTVLDWCLSTLCPDIAAGETPYEKLGALAETSEAGSRGVVFVPYLSASGVIAPRIEPRARAGFHGLAPHHQRADMVRAVHEGMAYAIRDCYAHIGGSVSTIRLAGGGARSPFWSQMIADVTGLAVEIPEGSQFGAKGAALCAATAIGRFASIGEACAATFRSKRTHDPEASESDAYAAGFRRFKTASAAALDALAPVAE
jgi:sugar (pentulose or hexulose) kinase